MKPKPWIVSLPHFDAAFSAVEGEPLVYEKEIAYESLFTKRTPLGDPEFQLKIDRELIDHWVDTFYRMKSSGIPVPVPLGHSTDPDKRVGTVLELERRELPERKGRASLFARIKFHSPEAAQKYAHSDVSLFMPPLFYSGDDQKFVRPIRHVCITDYPVIPNLKGFEKALAFSLDEDPSMGAVVALAERLGIPLPEGADDDVAADAIAEQFAAMQNPEESEEPMEEESMEEEPMEEEDEEQLSETGMGFSSAPILPSVRNSVVDARTTKIDALVKDGKVSPVVAKQLKAMYCTPDAVQVSLSLEAAGHMPDDFEGIVKALSLGPSMKGFGGGSPAPTQRSGSSSIVQDALRRAEAAKRASR